jgi:hypothetical protein
LHLAENSCLAPILKAEKKNETTHAAGKAVSIAIWAL